MKPPRAQSEPNFIVLQRSVEQRLVLLGLDARGDLVSRFDTTRRADAAGRALAAGFDGAEFHGETGLLQHVGGIVKDGDAGMADQAVLGGEGLVVERRIEQCAREIGAERTADLYGLDRPSGCCAATDLIDDLARASGRRPFHKDHHA